MPAEDTGPIRPHDVPQFVYKTELTSFNDWDTRPFPPMAPRPEVLRIRSTAVYMDAKGLLEYVDKLVETLGKLGFEKAMSPSDQVLRKDLHKLWEHIERNRSEIETDGRTVVKFPLESQKYLGREWEISAKANARIFRNLMEMEYLYGMVHGLAVLLSASIENWIGDMDTDEMNATQNALDSFRYGEYDDVRKSLVRGRYKVRAAKGKED